MGKELNALVTPERETMRCSAGTLQFDSDLPTPKDEKTLHQQIMGVYHFFVGEAGVEKRWGSYLTCAMQSLRGYVKEHIRKSRG